MSNLNWGRYDIDISQVRGGKGNCPKCHHTRKNKADKSLSVDKVTGMFKCHNNPCDFEGCAMDRNEELVWNKQEIRTYNIPTPKLQKVGDKMLSWFMQRGITNNTLLRFNLTESQEWMPIGKEGKVVTVICFNYYRGEELVNIKYRSGDKRFRLEKGAELIFYNLNALYLGKEIVIVEGEIDALSVWEAGIGYVVSVPNGASLSKNAKLEYLDNCWQDFDHITRVIIATDNDEAGGFLRDELVRRLGAERCYTVNYPEGCKDANEVLVNHGPAVLKSMIESAVEIPLHGVALVADEMEDMIHIYKNGYPATEGAGWRLDNIIKWRVSELTTITGTPGSGKSTWLNSLLERMARYHGWAVAMFTPEKTPVSLLIAELASIHVGEPYYRSNPADKMTPEQAKEALQFINSFFYFLRRDEVSKTIDGLIEKAIECVKRYGIKAFVIDPWNYIDFQVAGEGTETSAIRLALSKLADFAKRYGVHVFIVAHPAKIRRIPGVKGFPVPTMSDISGSAHFWNMTDNGISIYRNRDNGTTEIHIQKVRWWFVGHEGMEVMHFEKKSQRFLDSPPLSSTPPPEPSLPFD